MNFSAIKNAQKRLKELKATLAKLSVESEKLQKLVDTDEAAVKKLNARIDNSNEELRKIKKFKLMAKEQMDEQDSIIAETLDDALRSLRLDDALQSPWLPYFYEFAKSRRAEENIDFLLIRNPKKAYEKFLKGKTTSNVDINISGENLDNAHAAYSYEYEKKGDRPRSNLATVLTAIRNEDIQPSLQGILGNFKNQATAKQAASEIAGA